MNRIQKLYSQKILIFYLKERQAYNAIKEKYFFICKPFIISFLFVFPPSSFSQFKCGVLTTKMTIQITQDI